MNNHASRTDRIGEALANKVVRWRWLVILATLALVVVVGIGAPKLTLSTSYQSFFSPDYPELVAFEEFQKTYSKTDNILFVIQPSEKNGFHAAYRRGDRTAHREGVADTLCDPG